MWWLELQDIGERLSQCSGGASALINATAVIQSEAILDDSAGAIAIGAGSIVCSGAMLRGPIAIGRNCLIGNLALIRGPVCIGDEVRIGFTTEIKHSIIGHRVSIGPQCFVGDSRIDQDAYLGAQVRTSNQRLDRKPIKVRDGVSEFVTDFDRLGCWIGAGASLGIQVIVLPGRVIAPGSIFEPRITVTKNLPSGHYRASQTLVEIA